MKKRFQWEVRPNALPENTVVGEKYRFTVLESGLIRMEYAADGVFEDRASQSFFYRDLPKCNFSCAISQEQLVLETDQLVLRYIPNAPFAANSLSVQLKCSPCSTWNFGDAYEDLGGTARTLDAVHGGRPLGGGVCSRNGFAVIDDSQTMLLEEDGWFGIRRENTVDCYFFGYGHNYLGAVQALYRVTGAPPLLPAYALGNWWSRYYKYTQDGYLALMDRFKEENVPFSVGVVDIDWHIRKIPEYAKRPDPPHVDPVHAWNNAWGGYSWDKNLFPDYKAFLKELKKRNLKTALNLHPACGTGPFEDMYEEMAKANGIDPATKEWVPLDILSPKHMETYFDVLHHPYEKDGVDFWWMDWQQGKNYWWIHEANKPGEYKDPLERMDPLWLLNHLHILDIQRDGKRPMFFSRYAGPGSHRYPVGFSGDTTITWESLDFQPYFTTTASNIGYSWWSHDIGGHMGGIRDDELFVRWLQLGVFSPVNRLHSSSSRFLCKEPWCYGPEARLAIGYWMRLRHRLFPYLYAMNYRNHQELIPLVQPMYYLYPECAGAYEMPNQFFFGSELMVAPITQKGDSAARLGSTQVWLPAGSWFDLFSGLHYASRKGRKMEVCRTLDRMPVFAKAGGIVPMAVYADGDNRLTNSGDMDILVFPGKSNRFTLTEDAGDGDSIGTGAIARTELSLDWGERAVFTIAAAKGDTTQIPVKRNWCIGLRGFQKTIGVEVSIDGKPATTQIHYEKDTNTTWVTVSAAVTEEVKLQITGEMLISMNEDVLDRCEDLIQRGQYTLSDKTQMWDTVRDESTKLKRKCMALGFRYSQHHIFVAALQELLSLTEDQYLGCQLPE